MPIILLKDKHGMLILAFSLHSLQIFKF